MSRLLIAGVLGSFALTALAGCSLADPLETDLSDPSTWVREEAGAQFSFMLPPSLVEQDVQGIDSYVGRYLSEAVDLTFDYGAYSNDLANPFERHADYTSRHVEVSGRTGRLVRFRYSDDGLGRPYFAGLHLPEVAMVQHEGTDQYERIALTLSATCRTNADCSAMEAVLVSVEFPD